MLTQDAIRLGIHKSCKKQKDEKPEVPTPNGPIKKEPKMKELRVIAKALGIPMPFGTKKVDLIKLINEKGEGK